MEVRKGVRKQYIHLIIQENNRKLKINNQILSHYITTISPHSKGKKKKKLTFNSNNKPHHPSIVTA